MPTYAYACTACAHRFEAQQSFTDDALTDCPQCSGRLRKLFSSVGIVFKGSGFYRTDSRSGTSSSTPAATDSSSSGSSTSSGSSSSAKNGSDSSGSSSSSNSSSSGSSSTTSSSPAPAGSAA